MSAYDEGTHSSWNPEASNDDTAPSVSTPSALAHTAFDLARLADALPKLGSVLWLERRVQRASHERSSARAHGIVLLEHPSLGALSQCADTHAHHAVTPLGPREWLSFHDRAGDPLAKMFLLPDTDYLAWDEMTAACRLTPSSSPTSRWNAHGAFLRGALARLGHTWRARLLTFELRRLPWLRTLDARAPLRISLLGLELARAIARDEGAELVSPLHTA
jgi:hypothetical protein